MGAIKVPTSFNIDLEFEIPEFHRRLFAWMIDLVVQFVYIRVASELFYQSVSYQDVLSEDSRYNMWGIQWMIYMPALIYYPLCEALMNGQSVGKKLIRLRVVDENGGRASLSQFFIRWLVRAGDWAMLLILAANVLVLIDKQWRVLLLASMILLIVDIILVVSSKKGQRLGDILARTVIVRTTAQGSMEETVFMEVADNYVPIFPEIMKLSDRDINAIKSILDASRKKGDFNLAVMASEKIKAHLKITTTMSPYDFLDTLMKDYNYLSVK